MDSLTGKVGTYRMDGEKFYQLTCELFGPHLSKLGFTIEAPDLSGKLYCVSYVAPTHRVWVSYEPGEDSFDVLVFNREARGWSDIDNSSRTARLAELNRRYQERVTPQERQIADAAFCGFIPKGEVEKRLIKGAKDLTLVLGRYISER